MSTHRFQGSPALRHFLSSALRFLVSSFLCLPVSPLLLSPAFAQPPDRAATDNAGFRPEHKERIYTPEEIARDMGAPSTLILHLKDATPQQVFDEVTAQSGMEFVLNGATDAKVSVDCQAQPFWPALAAVLRQTGYCIPGNYGGGSKCYLQPARYGHAMMLLSGPLVSAGPFLMELERCNITKTRAIAWQKPLGQDQNAENPPPPPLRIDAQLLCDPKLRIQSAQYSLETARDDTGKSLISINAGSPMSGGTQRVATILYLSEPDPAAKLVQTLSGSLRVEITSRTQQWEIPDPIKVGTATKTFGPPDAPLTVTIKAHKKEGDNTGTIDIALTVEGNNVSWQLVQTVQNDMRLVDVEGKPTGYTNSGFGGGGDNRKITYNSSFRLADPNQAIAEPISLRVDVPIETRTVLIPFEFHDLPLP